MSYDTIPGAEWRGRGHEGTEEARNDHGDDAEEVVEKTDQRRGIERGQGSVGTGGCR